MYPVREAVPSTDIGMWVPTGCCCSLRPGAPTGWTFLSLDVLQRLDGVPRVDVCSVPSSKQAARQHYSTEGGRDRVHRHHCCQFT
eukprot:2944780-Rhodomonas_salina.2